LVWLWASNIFNNQTMRKLPFRKSKIGAPPYIPGSENNYNPYDSGENKNVLHTYDGVSVEDNTIDEPLVSSSNLMLIGVLAVGLYFMLK
jgi:hypothetical protein